MPDRWRFFVLLCGQLAPGGRAVYSTCSLEREENEAVVEEVLRDAAEYRLRDSREELEQLRATGELVWTDFDSLVNGQIPAHNSRCTSVRRIFRSSDRESLIDG